MNALQLYFGRLRELLFHPSRFYARIRLGSAAYDALAFGIVTSWWVNGVRYALGVDSAQHLPFFSMATGLGAVILTPFVVGLKIISWSLILWVSLALLLPESSRGRPWLSTLFCILGYAMSAQIIALVPWVGSTIAPLWIAYLAWTGLKECFEISSGRALMVMILPYLFVMAIFGVAMIFFGIMLFQIALHWILPLLNH